MVDSLKKCRLVMTMLRKSIGEELAELDMINFFSR